LNNDARPVLIVVAGPNGSGKTSLTIDVLQHQWIEGCVYINPDNIARDIFGDWNSLEAIRNAARLAETRREESLTRGESVAFESVLSAPDKVDFIYRAKCAGYFVRLFFVGTDHPSINASRIAHRVIEGGHDVPISKIISRYSKSIANCAAVATFTDRAYIYDNSVDDAEPKLLFRTIDGKIAKTYCAIPEWAKSIVDAIPHSKEFP
jgi:predicted ABC-type ATPase